MSKGNIFLCENKLQSITSLTGGHSGTSDLVKCYKGFLNHNIDILEVLHVLCVCNSLFIIYPDDGLVRTETCWRMHGIK